MAQIDRRHSLLAADLYVDAAARPLTDAASAAAKPGGGARVLSFFLQTFVMAVALVLFFLFAGVAAVFLLHLCVVGRAFRRRRRSVAPAATDRVPGDTQPGLSDAQMKDLPWFEYVVRSACSQWPPPECAVCMEGMRMGERCRALPPCGHVFHVVCVDRWLVRSPSCPICRACVGAVAAEPPIGRPLGNQIGIISEPLFWNHFLPYTLQLEIEWKYVASS